MKLNDISKIDLQHCPVHHTPSSPFQITENTCIGRTFFPHDRYVYNVQPTIWKTNSLIEVLDKFKEHTYRSIESSEIQQYCSNQMKCYRTVSINPISMGYYSSIKEFIFLHLTHFYQLLPTDPSINKMCKSGNDFYQKEIIPKLLNSGREFRTSMY
jgi:hypothetical protein